jgi:cytochrome c oxidase assembly protein subunit 11
MEQAQPAPARHNRLIIKLLLMVAGAFIFAFALVPIYNVLCEATGFNGKTSGKSVIRDGFGIGGLQTGTVMPGLSWDMHPLTLNLDIHPGELQQVSYLVRNTSDRSITGQAVPSVTPGQAAQHFEKIECFCFSQQTLAPGEAREMPLAFIVKPEVDDDISHITLSYAFFGLDGQRQTLTSNGEAR